MDIVELYAKKIRGGNFIRPTSKGLKTEFQFMAGKNDLENEKTSKITFIYFGVLSIFYCKPGFFFYSKLPLVIKIPRSDIIQTKLTFGAQETFLMEIPTN